MTSQSRFDIYFREELWGSVELEQDRMIITGPKDLGVASK